MSALTTWSDELRARRIPDEVLAAAPESPYGFPQELFRRRASAAQTSQADPTPTTTRALEALPARGTLLDVGAGGGATSLPLATRAGLIVGVDGQQDMLDAFADAAAAAGVEVRTIVGAWPDVASQAPVADVVVCGHVAYNVADLAPFARALDEHAVTRVVIELTERHPIAWMADLWETFHGLTWPAGPTAEEAREALRELGFEASRDERVQTGNRGGGFARREDAVALVRRRLCVKPESDDDVAAALGDRLRAHDGLWSAGPALQTVVTLWWDR